MKISLALFAQRIIMLPMQAIPILSQPMASLGLHSRLNGSDRFASLNSLTTVKSGKEASSLLDYEKPVQFRLRLPLSPYPAILSLPSTQTIKDESWNGYYGRSNISSRQSYVPLVLNNDKVSKGKTTRNVAWVGGAISGTIAPIKRSSESRNGSTNPQRREALRVGFDLTHIEPSLSRSMGSPQPRFLSPLVGGFFGRRAIGDNRVDSEGIAPRMTQAQSNLRDDPTKITISSTWRNVDAISGQHAAILGPAHYRQLHQVEGHTSSNLVVLN